MSLKANARPKKRTTIARPDVDMAADVMAIRNGEAMRVGNRYEINGRVYELEPTGRLFPVRGEGLVQLDRNEFKALTLLIRHGGRTVEVEEQFRRDPAFSQSVVAKAIELFERRIEG